MNTVKMNIRLFQLLLMVLLLGLMAVGSAVNAAPGGTPGKPGGGGPMSPPDFGDLFVLLRDASGIPILTPELCQQPLAAPGVTLPAIGDIPECVPASETESCVIPVDPATCGVVLGYETYTQEVDFGRINEARSPVTVFESQLEDVVVNLATADCVTLDPAGRMVTSVVTTTDTGDVVTSATIDSPLQNLAIYRQLMMTGYLGAETTPLTLPSDPLNTAARSLGAASDKAGKVGVDLVVYLNQILGLTDLNVQTILPKTCINVREEVKGVVTTVQKCFLNYGPTTESPGYGYDRSANFGALPSPAYIPADAPQDGWFEYLSEITGAPMLTFGIVQDAILDTVPDLVAAPTLVASNIGGFAQAADDARATIEFMHSWPVPGDYVTPIPCVASGITTYDVSISDISGLQVPVRMVAGTEGREFTLTVANAGPDAATGTVTLTAIDANGLSLQTFPRTFAFTLVPGTSQSWTEQFSIDYATTITWTAHATAPFDVNPANNSVTATTKVTGGGGGRGGGIR